MPRTGPRYTVSAEQIPYDHVAFISSENVVDVLVSEDGTSIVDGGVAARIGRFSSHSNRVTAGFASYLSRVDLTHLSSLVIDNLNIPLRGFPQLKQVLLQPDVVLERLQLTNCTGTPDWIALLRRNAFPCLAELNLAGSDYAVTRVASALIAREEDCKCLFLTSLVLTEEFVDTSSEDWRVLTELGGGEEYVYGGGDALLFAYTQISIRLPCGFDMVASPEPLQVDKDISLLDLETGVETVAAGDSWDAEDIIASGVL